MSRPVVIVGCGGFGREVRDVIDACSADGANWDFLGYLDEDPSASNLAAVAQSQDHVLGGLDWLDRAPKGTHVFIGIADGDVRARIDQRLVRLGLPSDVLVHPSATAGRHVTLGPGTIVCAGVRMTTNIRLGRHVHVNLNCTVGHDCVLGDYVTVNPLVAISGNVVVGPGTMLGTHAAVLQGLRVGAGSTVGGSALVVKDVPDGVVVKGVPAR